MGKTLPKDWDVIIIGGGLVGACLAAALARIPLRVLVVEADSPIAADTPADSWQRPIALSESSRRILHGLGLWTDLAPLSTPIEGVHISDRGHFGVTRLRPQETGTPSLGQVVADAELLARLRQQAGGMASVRFLQPAELVTFDQSPEGVNARIRWNGTESTVSARLLVAADGTRSAVRRRLGVGVRRRDYGQTAVACAVNVSRGHGNWAYERFTGDGVCAVLPMGGAAGGRDRCGLVWIMGDGWARQVADMDDATFLLALQACFGGRLGCFGEASPRRVFPLHAVWAAEQVRGRTVLLGNAAHTLHPLGAQGFNLGLRDMATLAELLADAVRQDQDPGGHDLLQEYVRRRRSDQTAARLFVKALLGVFANRFPPAVLARNLGLLGADLLPALKVGVARRATGLGGWQPRLVRGASL